MIEEKKPGNKILVRSKQELLDMSNDGGITIVPEMYPLPEQVVTIWKAGIFAG